MSDTHVKFIEYTGKWPNLCRGILTLEIDGKEAVFGYDYKNPDSGNFDSFWESGGSCGFSNNYSESHVESNRWLICKEDLLPQYRKYAEEIDEVFNGNVHYGCCGGCL